MRRLILLMAAMGTAVLMVSGVAYALSVQCDGAGDQDPNPGRCVGTQEDDQITGTDQRDVIRALDGFDDVLAGAGQDELNGGILGDYLLGDEDDDTYYGGRGADNLSEFGNSPEGDSGSDLMEGGKGPDYMEGSRGYDILLGGEGDESDSARDVEMYGDQGNDDIYGRRATTAWKANRAETTLRPGGRRLPRRGRRRDSGRSGSGRRRRQFRRLRGERERHRR